MPTSDSRIREVRLFRNNRHQAVHISIDFELPGDSALIHREGDRLIIEPANRPVSLLGLLEEWKREGPLGPDDQLPDITDTPVRPEHIF